MSRTHAVFRGRTDRAPDQLQLRAAGDRGDPVAILRWPDSDRQGPADPADAVEGLFAERPGEGALIYVHSSIDSRRRSQYHSEATPRLPLFSVERTIAPALEKLKMVATLR